MVSETSLFEQIPIMSAVNCKVTLAPPSVMVLSYMLLFKFPFPLIILQVPPKLFGQAERLTLSPVQTPSFSTKNCPEGFVATRFSIAGKMSIFTI